MSTASDTLKKKDKEKKGGVGVFIRDTRSEWDKTSFPSREDVTNTTIIVMISVVFFAIYLYLLDRGWVFVLEMLTWLVNRIAGI